MSQHEGRRQRRLALGREVRQAPGQLNQTVVGRRSGISSVNGNMCDNDDAERCQIRLDSDGTWIVVNNRSESHGQRHAFSIHPSTTTNDTPTRQLDTRHSDEQDDLSDILSGIHHPLGEQTFNVAVGESDYVYLHAVQQGAPRCNTQSMEVDLRFVGERHANDKVNAPLYGLFFFDNPAESEHGPLHRSEPTRHHMSRDDDAGDFRRRFEMDQALAMRSRSS